MLIYCCTIIADTLSLLLIYYCPTIYVRISYYVVKCPTDLLLMYHLPFEWPLRSKMSDLDWLLNCWTISVESILYVVIHLGEKF